MDLSIIILNYNTKGLLKNLLLSIKKADKGKYKTEIIVVDNASTDGSQEMLLKDFPKVYLIRNSKNLGYSKANNIGADEAKGEFLLFLNSDTLVYKDTLIKCLQFIKNKNYQVATCRVELENGNLDPASHRGFPTPWASFTYFFGLEQLFPHTKIFSQYHQRWKNLNTTHKVDAISGAFFLINKKTFFRAGRFDEDYFMYGEDLDLCFKINKMNIPIYFYPDTKIIHFKKRSGRRKSMNKSDEQSYEIIRNKSNNYFFNTMKIFYDKNYKNTYPRFVRQLITLGIDIMRRIKE